MLLGPGALLVSFSTLCFFMYFFMFFRGVRHFLSCGQCQQFVSEIGAPYPTRYSSGRWFAVVLVFRSKRLVQSFPLAIAITAATTHFHWG